MKLREKQNINLNHTTMLKNEIEIGKTLLKANLRVAEKVEKEEFFDQECTHVNVLVTRTKQSFDDMAGDKDVDMVLIHAGTATKRYKNFNLSKVIEKPTIANIFFAQK